MKKNITIIFPKKELFDPERVEFWDLAFGYSSRAAVMSGSLKKKASGTSLTLAILGSLVPEEFDVTLIDEYVEEIDFDKKTDLLILTFFTTEATRGYIIADTFREKGIPVIIGGYHASMMPDEALEHADSLALGEAETLMATILNDFKNGSLKRIYRMEESERPDLADQPLPRWDKLKLESYHNPMIQTMRGCPMRCEFCSVSLLWGPKYRFRPIEKVIEEIRSIKDRFGETTRYMIVDDDISAIRSRTKELCRALAPLNISWMSQGSLAMANDNELLELLAMSGGTRMIVGFESITEETLAIMEKNPANKIAEYSTKIKKIQSYGLAIISTFVLGYDNEDVSVFENTADFVIDNHLGLPQFFCVTPFPGTVLTKRLEREGRVLSHDWKRYTGTTVQFMPEKMTPDELQDGYYYANQKVYSFKNIWKRLMGMWDLWDTFSPNPRNVLIREKIDTLLLNLSFNYVSYKFPSCYKPDPEEEKDYQKKLNNILKMHLHERSMLLGAPRAVNY
ncbi:MAG: B12-binding domain-containing radical SAM protein [Spirochaetes bacterium]|nr:B12-binding domain-containing radical SAM protein [Spirochaetota bacterium]